jgi:hypothetical protein
LPESGTVRTTPLGKHPAPHLADRLDNPPPVLIARDVLESPRPMLTALCARLGVPFDESMLHWPPGPRPTDGLWAPHWYTRVNASTGFAPYRPKPDRVPDHLQGVLETCQGLFGMTAADLCLYKNTCMQLIVLISNLDSHTQSACAFIQRVMYLHYFAGKVFIVSNNIDSITDINIFNLGRC